MLDFSSALYLGFKHASSNLPAWSQLSLGKPSALEELDGTAEIEQELAALVGCESAVLGTSTLHLFWDLFGMLAELEASIFLDAGSYPIARWGVERAAAAGAFVRCFRSQDVPALRLAMRSARGRRPIVVTDGFWPMLGRPAPLAEYAECAADEGGLVVVDDTQALGIFGKSLESSPPYGEGGGGSLWQLTRGRCAVVVISSVAKAFGVPVAMLAGASRLITDFRRRSATRVHCSPPSAATLAAARRALKLNRCCGDLLRRRVAHRVKEFRKGLRALNLLAVPGCFPVQPLRLPDSLNADSIYERLLRRGVRPVLNRASVAGASRISFVFTARHRMSEIERALDVLAGSLRPLTE